ncbi:MULTISPECIES: respiratory chain complex I subunit 1 family protein [Ferrimonas]|uniref:respiratory chain complex I subunit 1 family protein n=1 Tax=Ferrimonas TaxID=44011 RepID=UPI00041BB010|nr:MULTISPECIES: complex I subunit 1 family protein [Ferrimonas]USD36393.1 NADH-quinone oxidoreductase subunit H [Ferrimonas sp. SCSIO 43195]
MSELLALLSPLWVLPLGMGALFVGLLFKGVDRIVVARLQRRIGPPLLQPFYDIAKLMQKRSMVPEPAMTGLFLYLPAAGVCAMMVAVALVPIPGMYQPPQALGDLLVLLYLLAVPAIVIMLAGSASGSTFGAIGFSREMSLMLAYEGPLLLVLISVAIRTGAGLGEPISLSLNEVVAWQQGHGAFITDPLMWPALLAFLSVIPANLGVAPFDIPEAESEILEGPLLEYSGPALAMFKLMSTLKTMLVLSLGVVMFWPSVGEGLWPLLTHLLKCLGLFLLAKTALRASVGRMRMDQAFIFYFKWPELLGVLSLILVVATV